MGIVAKQPVVSIAMSGGSNFQHYDDFRIIEPLDYGVT